VVHVFRGAPTALVRHSSAPQRLRNLDGEIVDYWDGNAILMAQALCSRLGLAVGISSGANFLGAAAILEGLGADATVVTLFPNSNKKYLSTDLCRNEPAGEDTLTPCITLERFRPIRLP